MNSIFCLFLMTTSVFGNDPIIDLPTGTIRGKVIGNNCSDYSCPSSCPFYSYTEIPFGQPPVGPLRFQAPKPVKSWTGVLDCTESRKLCFNVYGSFPYETEDCLLLNVYTPVPPCMRTKLPVLFQIYGGGFMNGVATFDALGPHYFMRENLVVVTTYYRIGPWGFLSTGDKVIPGNAGLKDQCLALKWVQTNIHLFGGDPRKVTVMGVSAGAASATYQLLSRRCGGTFRAAIALSGSALNPWAYQRHHVEVAYQVANNINPLFQRNNSTKEMFTFLQTVSNADLKNASLNIRLSYTDQMAQGFYFAPVTEVDNESAFLNRKMYGLLETGSFNRVPILMGISSEEELYRYADTNNFKLYMQTFDSNPRLLVPEDMHVTNDTEKLALGQIIRKLYTGGLLADDLIASVK
ncbi:putative inactive carboxylesterase 4 isoform X2 [Aethina tumida]|nr:putative inactive carboxylesterase 4 isoform X2 [Aethina tumida]